MRSAKWSRTMSQATASPRRRSSRPRRTLAPPAMAAQVVTEPRRSPFSTAAT